MRLRMSRSKCHIHQEAAATDGAAAGCVNAGESPCTSRLRAEQRIALLDADSHACDVFTSLERQRASGDVEAVLRDVEQAPICWNTADVKALAPGDPRDREVP